MKKIKLSFKEYYLIEEPSLQLLNTKITQKIKKIIYYKHKKKGRNNKGSKIKG